MEYSDFSTAEQLTAELHRRLIAKEPFPNNAGYHLLPYEPIFIVNEPVLPYTNYRAFENGGKWYIPVAQYDEKGQRNYATFEECQKWVDIYGIEFLIVDILSNYYTVIDEL